MSNILYLNSPCRGWMTLSRDRLTMAQHCFGKGQNREAQVWLDMAAEALKQSRQCAREPGHAFRYLPMAARAASFSALSSNSGSAA